jgi:hypothetical protein
MMTADIYTKPFVDRVKWGVLCQLLGIMTLAQVETKEMARLRQCTVLDDATTMLTSGYDLGSQTHERMGQRFKVAQAR